MVEPLFPGEAVLVVDDEAQFRESLRRALARHFGVADAASCKDSAIQALAAAAHAGRPYDAVVIDLFLGSDSGETVLEFAEHLDVPPRAVVVSAGAYDGSHMYRLLDRCAFLEKMAGFEFIVGALRPVPSVVDRFATCHRLTSQERTVLASAVEGLRDGEIEHRLDISTGTLRTYWRRIGTKVGAAGRIDIVSAVVRWVDGRGRTSGIFMRGSKGQSGGAETSSATTDWELGLPRAGTRRGSAG